MRRHSIRSALGLGIAVVGFATWAFVPPVGPCGGAPRQHQTSIEYGPLNGVDDFATAPPASEASADCNVLLRAVRWLGGGLAVGLLAAVLSAPVPVEAREGPLQGGALEARDLGPLQSGKLELCKGNKRFAKRIKDEIFGISSRQKKYPKGSVVYNRFADKIELVKKRQKAYGERYCGKRDGLPRVLVQPEVVKGGVVIPALMFLYTAGWIGWAGRSYLLRTRSAEKEINIDVPLAATCMASGFAWPVNAWQAIVNGEMVEKDENLNKSMF